MDTQALIEAVTAEVWRRLQNEPPNPVAGVACGGDWPGFRRYTKDMQAAQEKQALIVHLTPWSMRRLAHGEAMTDEEGFLLEMLLLGHDVALAPQALNYQNYRDSAPPALFEQYVAAEKTLYALGVRPWLAQNAHRSKKLLTADTVRELIDQGEGVLAVDEGTIITPLALDMLHTAHIIIRRHTPKEGGSCNWQK